MSTQPNTTGTIVLTPSQSKRPDYCPVKGTYMKDALKKHLPTRLIKQGSKFGHARTCRICDNKLEKQEWYFNMDEYRRNAYYAGTPNKVEITICHTCLQNFADTIKKNNNDFFGDSLSRL